MTASESLAFTPAEEQAVLHPIYARGDRLIGWFLGAHMLVACALAFYHDTYGATLAFGTAILGLFLLSRALWPARRVTRVVAGVCLQAFCALAIWQMHGMAEQHFWFFTAATVMILYQDWVAMWPGPLLIIVQHVWFATAIRHGETMHMFFEPSQVGVNKFLYHFGIALIEVVICSYLAYLLRRQTLRDAWQRAQLDRGRAELQESTLRMRAILDNIPDFAWVKGRDGRYLAANAALATVLGRPADTILGRTDDELFDRAVAERLRSHDQRVLAAGVPQRLEDQLSLGGGRVRDVETILTPIFDRRREVVGTTGIARDVSERKREERHRRALEAKMQETQKLESLGVLAGGIAHDFNNLLMGVLGNAGLARLELPPGSPVHECLENMETAALRAAELTRQMLAYAGKGQFVAQPMSLSAVVQEMVHLLGTVISKKATLRLELADGLPSIEADATQIRQVVMNLITNASDALADEVGTITIATGACCADPTYLASSLVGAELAPGEYVFVEVRDTGVGMTPETQARIFDPFFTTKFTGRGLGLAAVLGIMRGHQGAIRLESAPGQGTTFRLLFPAAAAHPAEVTGVELAIAEGSLRGRRVLVVDDEVLVRDAVTRMLRHLGTEPVAAVNGCDAISLLDRAPDSVDVVLLDMMMPEMSGEETFLEIHDRYPALPVILTSGYDEIEGASRLVDRGLAGFIHKPYRLAELQRALERALAD